MKFRHLAIWDKIRQVRSRIVWAFQNACNRIKGSADLPAKPAGRSFRKSAAKAAKIFSIFLTSLFIITLLFLLYSLILGKDDKGNISLGRYELMTVLTGSMEPEISAGDMVVIKKEDPDKVKLDDVITFYAYEGSESRVTHRVISIEEEGFITQGDANTEPDRYPVTPATYIGRVVIAAPFVGKMLTTPAGLMVVAGAFLVYAVLEAILKEKYGKKPVSEAEYDIHRDQKEEELSCLQRRVLPFQRIHQSGIQSVEDLQDLDDSAVIEREPDSLLEEGLKVLDDGLESQSEDDGDLLLPDWYRDYINGFDDSDDTLPVSSEAWKRADVDRNKGDMVEDLNRRGPRLRKPKFGSLGNRREE